ncbi:MAG: hypothetical protein ACLU5J_04385 [Christensenellales bacterium]
MDKKIKIRYNSYGEKNARRILSFIKSIASGFCEKVDTNKYCFLGIKIPQIKEFVKSHAITYDELYHIKLNQYVEQDILFGLF